AIAMTADHDGKIRISALGPGVWGNRIAAKIEDGSLGAPRFKLTVMYWDVAPPAPLVDPTDPTQITNVNRREPTLLEVFDNLTTEATSIDFFEKVINGGSSLIRVEQIKPIVAGPVAPLNPPVMLAGNGVQGTDGSPVVIADYQGR